MFTPKVPLLLVWPPFSRRHCATWQLQPVFMSALIESVRRCELAGGVCGYVCAFMCSICCYMCRREE